MDYIPRNRLSALLLGLLLAGSAQAQMAGLVATASDGRRQVLFVRPVPHFHLTGNESIHPQLSPEFNVTWDGFIRIDHPGAYRFHGHARILIDGNVATSDPIALQQGRWPIRIEFQSQPGEDRHLRVTWASEAFPEEPLPHHVLSHDNRPLPMITAATIEQGRRQLEKLNCIGCHATQKPFIQGRRAPELTDVGDRLKPAWIYQWLTQPKSYHARATMPDVLQSSKDRADVTAFLASLVSKPPEAVAAPETVAPDDKAVATSLMKRRGCLACHDPKTNPMPAVGSKMHSQALAEYLLDPLAHDPDGLMPRMGLSREEAELLARFLSGFRHPNLERQPPPGNLARGRQLVLSTGCLNCHSLKQDGEMQASTLSAPSLDTLNPRQGCQAMFPPVGAPRYAIEKRDRSRIDAWLRSPDRSEAPTVDFHRTVERLQCNACHELFGPARHAFAAPEAPPPLTDASSRLKSDWLKQVLFVGKRSRPWLEVRMPHHGTALTTNLASWFAQQAGYAPGDGRSLGETSPILAHRGTYLLGRGPDGLACIDCHDFKGQPLGAVMRGTELTTMQDRLRMDWLTRWLNNPKRIHAGTRMPHLFQGTPQSETDYKLGLLLQALSHGEQLARPDQFLVDRNTYALSSSTRPIFLRTGIVGSSLNGVVAILPDGLGFVFDEEKGRVETAWRGKSIQVLEPNEATSLRQTTLPEMLFYQAPDHPFVQVGDVAPDHQPVIKFKGYQLKQESPEFTYQVDGLTIRESIISSSDGQGIVRSLQVGAREKDVRIYSGQTEGIMARSSVGMLEEGWLTVPAGPETLVQFLLSPPPESPEP